MYHYAAEIGLKLLEYLGLTITDEEKKIFKEKWDKNNHKDILRTTKIIYVDILPFFVGKESLVISRQRDKELQEKLETTGLMKELEKGTPLEKILEFKEKE